MQGKIFVCLLDDNDKIITKKQINVEWSVEDEKTSKEFFSGSIHHTLIDAFYRDMKDAIDMQFVSEFVKDAQKEG